MRRRGEALDLLKSIGEAYQRRLVPRAPQMPEGEGAVVDATARAEAQSAPAHISPEEAVAHIQALLQAKQERVKQGPSWPGANASPQPGNGDNHNHAGNHGADAIHNHVSHARGDQSKNGNS